jgi:predicted HicB family RNase H-like nuclease
MSTEQSGVDRRRITVYVDRGVFEWIKELAERDDRSLSKWVERKLSQAWEKSQAVAGVEGGV